MDSFDRLAIIGDVHGQGDRLKRALDLLARDPRRRLIFTGDYVNRGDQAREVIDLLLQISSEHGGGVTLLKGNHEESLLRFLDGGMLSDFVAHGGLSTMRSYLGDIKTGAVAEFIRSFPEDHIDFLANLSVFFEDEGVLVSHSGFNVKDVRSRSPQDMFGIGHPELFSHGGPWPRELTVCGHYVQPSGKPFMAPHFVCVDTGCGTLPDGPLTALLLPEFEYMQF